MAELVDALDSKSSVRKDVWVRVPPSVQIENSAESNGTRSTVLTEASGSPTFGTIDFHFGAAAVAELVDAHVSEACARKGVGVRLPPAAP